MESLRFGEQSPENVLQLACLKLRRGRVKEAERMIEHLLKKDKFNCLYTTLISYIYQDFHNEARIGKRYFLIAQKLYQKQQGGNATKKEELPTYYAIPGIHAGPNQQENKTFVQLPNDQKDQIWLQLLTYFSKHNLYDLCDKIIEKINDKQNLEVMQIQAKLEFFKGNYDESLAILNHLISRRYFGSSLFLCLSRGMSWRSGDREAEG